MSDTTTTSSTAALRRLVPRIFSRAQPSGAVDTLVRTVRMSYLGDGVYQRPTLVCECNPLVEMRYAFTMPSGVIWDEVALSEPDGPLVLIPAVPEPMEPPC